MATQQELNDNPCQFMLYYCGVTQLDTTIFRMDCDDVADYDLEGKDNNFEITTWKLSEKYAEPSPETLMTYSLTDVMNFYTGFYQLAFTISEAQACKVTSTQLSSMSARLAVDDSLLDMVVYNTTLQKRLYLKSDKTWAAVNP
jgi:hypothetical protein